MKCGICSLSARAADPQCYLARCFLKLFLRAAFAGVKTIVKHPLKWPKHIRPKLKKAARMVSWSHLPTLSTVHAVAGRDMSVLFVCLFVSLSVQPRAFLPAVLPSTLCKLAQFCSHACMPTSPAQCTCHVVVYTGAVAAGFAPYSHSHRYASVLLTCSAQLASALQIEGCACIL